MTLPVSTCSFQRACDCFCGMCVFVCLCPHSTRRKQSTFTDLNLNDSPVSSYRPWLVSWVENVAPMLPISCDRNQQYLVPAWSRIHLGKAAATMLLKEFLFLVKPKDTLPCSQETATAN
jgi:hypothetical protein